MVEYGLTNGFHHLTHCVRKMRNRARSLEWGEGEPLMLLLMNVAVETRDPYHFIKIRIKRASIYALAKVWQISLDFEHF